MRKEYCYDAFGVERDADPNDPNLWRYYGEYFDGETGTYYLQARYYVPVVGRFTQADTHWHPGNSIYGDNPQDPLGLGIYVPDITAIMQSGNLYVYCTNNSLMYIDPSGEDIIWLTATGSAPVTVKGQTIYLGHTSSVVQDKDGGWHYFYWGESGAFLVKVEDFNHNGKTINPMSSLDNFNLWLS